MNFRLNFPLKMGSNKELYKNIGSKNWDRLVQEQPDLKEKNGVELALAVLRLYQFPDIHKAEEDQDVFFQKWCNEYDLNCPAFQNKRNKSDREARMIQIKIIGLAIIIALAGGSIILKNREKPKKSNKTKNPKTTPAEPQPQPIHESLVFVLAVHSGKLRSIGRTPEKAGELLADGQYWWLGKSNEWPLKQEKMNLKEVKELPDSNDAVVIVVYDIKSASGNPTSRPEASAWLRDLARQNMLHQMSMYIASQPSLLGGELRR